MKPLSGMLIKEETPDPSFFLDQDKRKEQFNLVSSKGMEIIRGNDPFILLLDLDGIDNSNTFLCNFTFVSSFFPMQILEEWVSQSGHGRHVLIGLEQPLEDVARIALQMALGSDIKKEVISLARLDRNLEDPIVLFKPPIGYTGGKVTVNSPGGRK